MTYRIPFPWIKNTAPEEASFEAFYKALEQSEAVKKKARWGHRYITMIGEKTIIELLVEIIQKVSVVSFKWVTGTQSVPTKKTITPTKATPVTSSKDGQNTQRKTQPNLTQKSSPKPRPTNQLPKSQSAPGSISIDPGTEKTSTTTRRNIAGTGSQKPAQKNHTTVGSGKGQKQSNTDSPTKTGGANEQNSKPSDAEATRTPSSRTSPLKDKEHEEVNQNQSSTRASETLSTPEVVNHDGLSQIGTQPDDKGSSYPSLPSHLLPPLIVGTDDDEEKKVNGTSDQPPVDETETVDAKKREGQITAGDVPSHEILDPSIDSQTTIQTDGTVTQPISVADDKVEDSDTDLTLVAQLPPNPILPQTDSDRDNLALDQTFSPQTEKEILVTKPDEKANQSENDSRGSVALESDPLAQDVGGHKEKGTDGNSVDSKTSYQKIDEENNSSDGDNSSFETSSSTSDLSPRPPKKSILKTTTLTSPVTTTETTESKRVIQFEQGSAPESKPDEQTNNEEQPSSLIPAGTNVEAIDSKRAIQFQEGSTPKSKGKEKTNNKGKSSSKGKSGMSLRTKARIQDTAAEQLLQRSLRKN